MWGWVEIAVTFVYGFFLLALGGCDLVTASDSKPDVIKTSHKEIAERFSSNSDEALKFYKNKAVCLYGTVDTIYGFGAVVMVADSNDRFRVNFLDDSRQDLITMNPGDKITVSCNKVSRLYIGDCSVVK